MQTRVLFNFTEFRTGVWLAKAYLVGVDDRGRPTVVHETASPGKLASYAVVADAPLHRALELAGALRDKEIAEAFRRGGKKVPALAGLLREGHREREAVLRHIHHRSSELLDLCGREGYPVTLNVDVRGVPAASLVRFAPAEWTAHLSFDLREDGLHYRLALETPGGEVRAVRHVEPRVLTNRPVPGWLVVGRELVQVSGLRGDAVKPFLTRDTVHIPPDRVGKYLREFVARAAVAHDIAVSGFSRTEVTRPTGLRVAARLHPFEERYYLYPEFCYGERAFPYADPERVAVETGSKPPYWLRRIVRDPRREREQLARLLVRGLVPVAGSSALAVRDASGPYAALDWLLKHGEELRALGLEIVPPEVEGRPLSYQVATLEIAVEERNDWLDLKGRIRVGDHEVPFSRLVRYIQREERFFPLPDGTVLRIPEEWFTRYRPTLQFVKLEGKHVRLARSQAPLLEPLGLRPDDGARAAGLAAAYVPSDRLRAELRPYQLEGARWLVRHYHERLGACLADDMGLGKTLQTIAVLLYAKEQLVEAEPATGADNGQIDLFHAPAEDEHYLRALRALVVLPASLVFNWAAELAKFAPSLTLVANVGTKRIRDARILRRHDVILTTYQTALRDQEVLGEIEFEYIVLDESQQIKNRQSKVFRALNGLQARHRISLSGTPIENSLSDLWSQMQFINPGLLRNYAFFRRSFINPIEVHDDERQKAQLRKLVGPHLLRRTKAEVAADLPQLDVQLYYCDMTPAQRRMYEREQSAARNALLGTPGPEDGQYKLRVIQTLTRLRQLANHPVLVDEEYERGSGKFSEVIEQWDTVRRSGQKVLIFSSLVRHLALFRAHLEALDQPFAWLTGSVRAADRAREIERFQRDPAVQTFFISIKAGGTGLNLTAADYVFILDPWWNPSIEDQAIARAHRIGRTGNVFARKFLTKHTLEEKINRLQERKKQLAEDIIGRSGGLDFDRGELEYLLG